MTIIVAPVNVATITEALVQQLLEWSGLDNTTVTRAEELNETPGSCPWIGVYRDTVSYVIKTIGYGSGFREQQVNLVVVVQESDPSSGAACEERLEARLKEVVGAVLTDVTLRGTVQVINDVSVRYTDYRKVGGGFMQMAAVYLTAVVPVSISEV